MAEQTHGIELEDGTRITIPDGPANPDKPTVAFQITKWFEMPDGTYRQFKAELDLFPDQARELSRALADRAGAVDPPKAAYERAYESRRVMMDPSLTWNEPMFGTVRPDWASAEHPDKYAVLWDKYADEPVEHRAYHWAYTLFPVLEEDGGRHVFSTPLPDPGSEVAW